MYINSTRLNMILVMMTIKFLAVNMNMNAVQLLCELEDFENNIKTITVNMILMLIITNDNNKKEF